MLNTENMSSRQRVMTPTTTAEESPSATVAEIEPLVVRSEPPRLSKPLPVHERSDSTASESSLSSASSSSSSSSETSTGAKVDVQQRDRHDIFNLVALPVVMAAICANWDIWSWIRHETSLPESCNLTNVFHLIGVTLSYFAVDLVWVSRIPNCVKSPGTIVKHHIVAMFYIMCPVFYPEYRCYMAPVLSVEFNTWFLILRRVLFLRKDSPYVPNTMRDIVDFAFYSSWIVIRVFAYNAMLLSLFPLLAVRHAMHQDMFFPLAFVATQVVLNLMNLKWSYDLFTPIIKRAIMNGGKDDNDGSGRQHTL